MMHRRSQAATSVCSVWSLRLRSGVSDSSRGNQIWNVEPRPTWLSTWTLPPRMSRRRLTRCSPNPAPPLRRDSTPWACVNGLNSAGNAFEHVLASLQWDIQRARESHPAHQLPDLLGNQRVRRLDAYIGESVLHQRLTQLGHQLARVVQDPQRLPLFRRCRHSSRRGPISSGAAPRISFQRVE